MKLQKETHIYFNFKNTYYLAYKSNYVIVSAKRNLVFTYTLNKKLSKLFALFIFFLYSSL